MAILLAQEGLSPLITITLSRVRSQSASMRQFKDLGDERRKFSGTRIGASEAQEILGGMEGTSPSTGVRNSSEAGTKKMLVPLT